MNVKSPEVLQIIVTVPKLVISISFIDCGIFLTLKMAVYYLVNSPWVWGKK